VGALKKPGASFETAITRETDSTMLTSIRRILVPVDFSENSENAVRFAVDIARERHARVFVLHVLNERFVEAVQELNFKGFKGDFVHSLRKLLEEKEQDLLQFVQPEWRSEVDMEMLVRRGDPADEVLEAAKDLSVDLITLGSLGYTASGSTGIGTVAREVASRALCSVLLVREAQHDFIG
jgi:nucleotide-binding universal stress UspA family protein